jgi:1-deoxy-D-xylulose-5-phosphate synthase
VRRAQRQRAQLRPDGLEAVRVADPAPSEPVLRRDPGEDRARARGASRRRPARRPVDEEPHLGAARAREPHVFFEALGIRYLGPIDGHDIASLEHALDKASRFPGPIVLHVLTRKGKGYPPAEADEVQCLHDLKAQPSLATPSRVDDQGALLVGPRSTEASYTDAFSKAVIAAAERDERVVAITAAMPGPTGLLAFEERFPERFVDVGIAESHAMTAAAGMAMGGLRPVVAIYSTFLSRCFDQENLDVGLHRSPVVICADRAGITGDDGPSHHGLLDMVLGLSVPDLAVFAPSEPAEVAPMLEAALSLEGPSLIRYPKTPGPSQLGVPGEGLCCRVLREGSGDVLLVGVGKLAKAALEAAELLAEDGLAVTVVDPRVVRPVDPALLERALSARLVVTAEDGFVHGGAGAHLRACLDAAASERGELGPLVVNLGVPTTFLAHAKPDVILRRLGLDGAGIASSTRLGLLRLASGRADEAEPPLGAQRLASGGGAASMRAANRGRVAR